MTKPTTESLQAPAGTIKGPHFARVPTAAITDRRVSPTEFRVIAAIASFADKHGNAYPAVETLAKMLGVSRQAIQKQIRAAEIHGHIKTLRRRRQGGGHTSNLYTLDLNPRADAKKTDADELNDCDGWLPSQEESDRTWEELNAMALGATLEVASLPKLIKYDWSVALVRVLQPQKLHRSQPQRLHKQTILTVMHSVKSRRRVC